MDHSPAYIIAHYLRDEGILSDPTGNDSWPVYVGALPDGDEVVHDVAGCIDTTPVKDGRLMSLGENLFHAGIQLLLRAETYNTGYQKAQAIATALEGVNRDEITISLKTYRIDNVSQTTGIVVMGQEEGSKRRELFSMNFLTTLKEI